MPIRKDKYLFLQMKSPDSIIWCFVPLGQIYIFFKATFHIKQNKNIWSSQFLKRLEMVRTL